MIKSLVIFTIPEKVLVILLSGKLLIIGLLKIVGETAEKIFLLIIKVSFENGFVPIILVGCIPFSTKNLNSVLAVSILEVF